MKSIINVKRKNITEQEGFTILEVMVAISILAFGLLGAASMQTAALRGNYFADSITEATDWAQDQIETFRSLSFPTDPWLSDGQHFGANGRTEGKYLIEWEVTDGPLTTTLPDGTVVWATKTINVIVSWSDQGVPRSITVQHILARTQYNT